MNSSYFFSDDTLYYFLSIHCIFFLAYNLDIACIQAIKLKKSFCCTLSGAIIAKLIPTLKNKIHKTKQTKPFNFYSIFIPSPTICLKLICIISNKTYFWRLKTVFCLFVFWFSFLCATHTTKLLTSFSKLFNTINFLLFLGVLFSPTFSSISQKYAAYSFQERADSASNNPHPILETQYIIVKNRHVKITEVQSLDFLIFVLSFHKWKLSKKKKKKKEKWLHVLLFYATLFLGFPETWYFLK